MQCNKLLCQTYVSNIQNLFHLTQWSSTLEALLVELPGVTWPLIFCFMLTLEAKLSQSV
jgi:hypothetical protein